MMGVVIHNDRAVALTLDLKPAAGAVEFFRCADGDPSGLRLQRTHAGQTHGQRIVNVVVAGHTKPDVGKELAQLKHIELKEPGLYSPMLTAWKRASLLFDAETQHRAVDGVDGHPASFLSSMLNTTVRDSSANFWNASLS